MSGKTLETDYLVVGAGAMALAFVDVMLRETDARFIIVDKRHAPGGHWNDSYSFLPSGRVTFLPMTEHRGDGEIVSLMSGERHRITIRKKLVDATRIDTTIPP